MTRSASRAAMGPALVRLIMQITRLPREIAEIILGYIPVRRRLTIQPFSGVLRNLTTPGAPVHSPENYGLATIELGLR